MVSSLLLALLATIHMLAAGLAGVGPLLAAGLLLSLPGQSPSVREALRRVAWWSLVALVMTGVVGLVAGVLRYQTEPADYATMLRRFPGQLYFFTTLEWLFAVVCLGVWYRAWSWGERHPWLHALLVLVATTNLLYHFPPLMIVQNLLVDRPDLVVEPVIQRQTYLSAVLSGEILARGIHYLAMATSFSAACTVMAISFSAVPGTQSSDLQRRCGWLGFASTLAQVSSGLMVLLLAPPGLATRLTGGSGLATGMLLAIVGIVLLLLVRWSELALSPSGHRQGRRLVHWIVMATLLMAFVARM